MRYWELERFGNLVALQNFFPFLGMIFRFRGYDVGDSKYLKHFATKIVVVSLDHRKICLQVKKAAVVPDICLNF